MNEEMPAATEIETPAVNLEQIFQEHHGLVFRAAYRVTGNAGDAEDVLQPVFLRLVRRPADAEAWKTRAAEMFALRFFEDRANPEIARLMGTTEGTVAVTLSRARDRVLKEFQACFGG